MIFIFGCKRANETPSLCGRTCSACGAGDMRRNVIGTVSGESLSETALKGYQYFVAYFLNSVKSTRAEVANVSEDDFSFKAALSRFALSSSSNPIRQNRAPL